MNFKKATLYVIGSLLLTSVIACSGPQVTRVDFNEEVDLSGYWNDIDSQQVTKEMLNDSFSSRWLSDFNARKDRKPRIVIGSVINKTEEHISTETFVKDLEISLINSGKAIFVTSKKQRAEIRAEKDDQAVNSKVGIKQHMETAADFILQGQVNSITDSNKKAQLKYYQVELELIDLETNETVWIGQKKIKKVISKRSYKI